MKYIIARHDEVTYYYHPTDKIWWPDLSTFSDMLEPLCGEGFKILDSEVDHHFFRAVELWKRPEGTEEVNIIDAP